jgi:hypothetical protein
MSGDFVGLRERRVVKPRIHQILDGAASAHDGLPDVYEFGCDGAEDAYSQQLPSLGETSRLSMS